MIITGTWAWTEMDKREFHLVVFSKDHHSSDRESVSDDGQNGMYSRDTVDIKRAGFHER